MSCGADVEPSITHSTGADAASETRPEKMEWEILARNLHKTQMPSAPPDYLDIDAVLICASNGSMWTEPPKVEDTPLRAFIPTIFDTKFVDIFIRFPNRAMTRISKGWDTDTCVDRMAINQAIFWRLCRESHKFVSLRIKEHTFKRFIYNKGKWSCYTNIGELANAVTDLPCDCGDAACDYDILQGARDGHWKNAPLKPERLSDRASWVESFLRDDGRLDWARYFVSVTDHGLIMKKVSTRPKVVQSVFNRAAPAFGVRTVVELLSSHTMMHINMYDQIENVGSCAPLSPSQSTCSSDFKFDCGSHVTPRMTDSERVLLDAQRDHFANAISTIKHKRKLVFKFGAFECADGVSRTVHTIDYTCESNEIIRAFFFKADEWGGVSAHHNWYKLTRCAKRQTARPPSRAPFNFTGLACGVPGFGGVSEMSHFRGVVLLCAPVHDKLRNGVHIPVFGAKVGSCGITESGAIPEAPPTKPVIRKVKSKRKKVTPKKRKSMKKKKSKKRKTSKKQAEPSFLYDAREFIEAVNKLNRHREAAQSIHPEIANFMKDDKLEDITNVLQEYDVHEDDDVLHEDELHEDEFFRLK